MKNIITIIKKNIKLLIRAKTSALIVILGPMLLIFLAGLAFDNTNAYRVSVGMYSPEFNDLTGSFAQKLGEKDFRVIEYEDIDKCVSDIKEGTTHICLQFKSPPVINKDARNEITFHVDYSKLNLVYAVLETVSKQVESRSEEISRDLTQVLVDRLGETKTDLENQHPVVASMEEENNAINAKAETIHSNLEDMELTINLDEFGLDDVKDKINELKKITEEELELKVDMNDVLSHTEGEPITEIKAMVSVLSNVSGAQKLDIMETLDEVRANLNYLVLKIENSSNSDAWDFKGLNQLTNHISTKLGDVQNQLDHATKTRKTVFTDIGTIRSTLRDNQNKLTGLTNAISGMTSRIDNVEVKKAADIVEPFKTVIKPVVKEKTYLNYLYPGLLIMVIMFISILLSSTLVIMEKNSNAYFRNAISPTKDSIFTLGIFFTGFLLMFLQVLIIISVALIYFKSQLLFSLHYILPMLAMVIGIFVLLGMIIGHFFYSEETGTLAAISTGSVLLLLSNFILPLESMPPTFMKVAQYNPFVIAESALKKILLFSTGFSGVATEMLILGGYFLGLLVTLFLVAKIMKKNYAHKYAISFAPVEKENK